jgi:hypothetical protein
MVMMHTIRSGSLKLDRLIVLAVLAASVAGAQQEPPLLQVRSGLRIDGERELLTSVGMVRSGPDGTVLLVERGGRRILVFDSTGRRVSEIGRQGQGPGEFQRINAVGMLGDTIWTAELSQYRLMLFHKSGRHLSSTVSIPSMRQTFTPAPDRNRPPSISGPTWEWGPPAALFPDGTMLMPATRYIRPSNLADTSRMPIWHTKRDGTILDTVSLQRSGAPVLIVNAGGASYWITNPLQRFDQFAIATDGRRLATISTTYGGANGSSYTVRVMNERGSRIYERHFPFAPRPVTPRVVDSVARALAEAQLAGRPPTAGRAPADVEIVTRAIRDSLGASEVFPPVVGARIDRDGSVWLRMAGPSDVQAWVILDPTGIPVGRVQLPGKSVFHALDNGVWMIEKNDDDVESAVRYTVVGLRR